MIKNFLTYLQYEKKYSSHTVLSYKIDLEQFCSFLQINPSDFEPNNVQSKHIADWVISLSQEKKTSRTISRKISSLKSFWKFLLINRLTTENPTKKIILPKTNRPLPAFYKQKEVDEVLQDDLLLDSEIFRNKLIIDFLYQTGLRVSELINVKIDDVDLVSKELTVIGKRNKQRKIPIGESLCKKIVEYNNLKENEFDFKTEFLFVTGKGKKMYSKFVYNIVHNTMQNVSTLYKQSPHVLRHTFATSLLNNGADINSVKELLGHSDLSATQIYTHLDFNAISKIYNKSHPRTKRKEKL